MNKLFGMSLLAAAVAVTGCSKKDDAPKTDAATATASSNGAMVVKIGHASPLTGPQAHLGKDNENGVRMAIEELNAKGVTIGGQKLGKRDGFGLWDLDAFEMTVSSDARVLLMEVPMTLG